jgi:hypothetical protein
MADFCYDGDVPLVAINSEFCNSHLLRQRSVSCTGVYPKISGLAAWNENSKWYSSLALGGDVSLFCEQV